MGIVGIGCQLVSHRHSFGLLQDFGVGAGGSAGVGGETDADAAKNMAKIQIPSRIAKFCFRKNKFGMVGIDRKPPLFNCG